MTFVWITFAVTLAIILGVYWAFVVRPESQDKDQLTGRLKTFKVKTTNITIANELQQGQYARFSRRCFSRQSRLVATSRTAARRVRAEDDAGRVRSADAAAASRLAPRSAGGRRGCQSAIILAVLFGSLPLIYVRRTRTKRLQTFEEQFPEAVELIARALARWSRIYDRAGDGRRRSPEAGRSEFRRVYDEQNFGMSLPEAFARWRGGCQCSTPRFFVTAVLTQRESGGNLSEVLDNLASVMRERFKVKRQIRVISAHGRLSAWILSSPGSGTRWAFCS